MFVELDAANIVLLIPLHLSYGLTRCLWYLNWSNRLPLASQNFWGLIGIEGEASFVAFAAAKWLSRFTRQCKSESQHWLSRGSRWLTTNRRTLSHCVLHASCINSSIARSLKSKAKRRTDAALIYLFRCRFLWLLWLLFECGRLHK